MPIVGLAAFTLILPMTLLVLAGIALVVLSYREVVSVYTRAGGSYVVARENFGPRVAQVAAVALLIDYVVTVAVQVAAGSAAIVSAFPQLGNIPVIGSNILTVISVIAVLIMCYGNLRGIREAGRAFALPTYLFSGSVALMIIVGLIRELVGGGLPHVGAYPGPTFPIGHSTQGLLSFGMIYMLARAFANGGSSLTGIEAVSNAVGALRPPEGRNARQILVTQGSIVAFLIAGISWLAHVTHAIPYLAGYPTVLAQEANVVFGSGAHFMYFVVQAATALILFTGGNTSFSGFPYLASFVAGDSFLPRWLTKRGHRLALSNGIIVLTVVSLALLIAVGANVNGLIPFYAIGVFTGFTMAGFGMAKYHKRVKERGWRRRRIINLTAAVYTAIVVAIFAIVKFTEGAWLIVIVFPVLVFLLIRLNREYRMESEVLENIGGRRAAGIPPQAAELQPPGGADLRGRRGPRDLRRDQVRARPAAHHAARGALRHRRRPGAAAAREVDQVRAGHTARDDRHPGPAAHPRLARAGQPRSGGQEHAGHRGAAAAGLLAAARPPAARPHRGQDGRGDQPGARRGRHDHPVRRGGQGAPAARQARREPRGAGGGSEAAATVRAKDGQQPAAAGTVTLNGSGGSPAERASGVSAIGELSTARKVTVEGKVSAVSIHPVENSCVLEAAVTDHTGVLTAKFYGRTSIPGFEPGVRVRLAGKVSVRETGPVMINPAYELLARGE